MTRYIRVTARPKNRRSTLHISFDLLLDAQDMVVGNHIIFAYQFDKNDKSIGSIPFVVSPSGQTDFGEAYVKKEGRFGHTDIRDRFINIGTEVNFRGETYDETYEISELRLLLTGTD